jgi:uncharacterized protein
MELKINVGNLPRAGSEIEFILKEEDVSIHEVIGDTHLSLEICKSGNSYDVRGSLEYELSLICSRCLKEFRQHEGCNFELEFKEKKESVVNGRFRRENIEAGNEYLVVNNCIDLGPFLNDEIILSLPIKPLCREECLGLCPVCGIDLNYETCKHFGIEEKKSLLTELKTK